MKHVNPELTSEADPSVALDPNSAEFAVGVGKLFGTKNRNVKRAVAEFLSKGAGALDHHNLRLVAAAAAAFEDVNHVAQIIRQIRPTGLDIAVKPISLETARAEFKDSLPDRYRPETKRNLVLDLINRTTLDILQSAPIERVPEQGREIVRDHLKKMIRGTDDDRRETYMSEFYDRTTLDAGLDYLQEQLDRAELETVGEQRVTDLNGATVIFGQVLSSHEGFAASDAQLDRAWNLYQKCVPNEQTLRGFVDSPRMMAAHGRSILGAVERCGVVDPGGASRLGHGIIHNPGSPEDVVRDVIHSSPESITGDSRIGVLRLNHYRASNGLLPTPTPTDLDEAVLSLPSEEITHLMVGALETDDALSEIVERSPELDGYTLNVLIGNPNLTSSHLSGIIEALRPEISSESGDRLHPTRPNALFARSDIDEHQLSALVEKIEAISPDSSQRDRLLHRAAAHPSSGPAIWEMVERHCRAVSERESSSFLRRIALASASTQVHDALTRLSIETHDEGMATDLMTNPVLRSTNWRLLRERFPDVEISKDAAIALTNGVDSLSLEGEEYNDLRELIHKGLCGYDRNTVMSVVASGDGSPMGFDSVSDSLAAHVHIDMFCDLLDNHGSGDRLISLTGDPDTHMAVTAATSPQVISSGRESEFVLPAMNELEETAHAVNNGLGMFPEDKKLHSWKKLPNRDDEPIDLTDLHKLIDGQVIDGLRIEVVKTRRHLLAASEEMRNCLSGYVGAVTRGTSIVVLARTRGDIYAAAFKVRRAEKNERAADRVQLGEVNSKFNEGNVSPGFEIGLAKIVRQINKGELRHVEKTVAAKTPAPAVETTELPTLATDDDLVVEAASPAEQLDERGRQTTAGTEASAVEQAPAAPPADRVRPQRRRPVPPLRTHVDPTSETNQSEQHLADAPCLLGGKASEVTEQQTRGDVSDVSELQAPAAPSVDPGYTEPTVEI